MRILVALFCVVEAYSLNNSALDILVMTGFGIAGYLMKKLKYEGAQAPPEKTGLGRKGLRRSLVFRATGRSPLRFSTLLYALRFPFRVLFRIPNSAFRIFITLLRPAKI